MPLGIDQKVGTVVWSPLGWGRLTGKIRRGQPLPAVSRRHNKEANDMGPPESDEYVYQVVDAIDQIAAETGKTVPQIALNWLLGRPTVATVIIGRRSEEQLRQNLGAVDWNLTPDQVGAVGRGERDAAPRGRRRPRTSSSRWTSLTQASAERAEQCSFEDEHVEDAHAEGAPLGAVL